MNGVKEVALVDRQDTALAANDAGGMMPMFERLARDPSVDVDKLERLMQMAERGMARVSAEQFNAAMTAAQKDMRPIAADGYNPQTKSQYATYEQIDSKLRPIYTAHGFGLSFNTGEAPAADMVRVQCRVTHAGGHSEHYRIDMPTDGKGAKGGDVMTRTHATGAAVSYGMRYLLKMIFNVAVGEGDDDGNSASAQTPLPPKPAGLDAWIAELKLASKEGSTVLEATWTGGTKENRQYVSAHFRDEWEALKRSARGGK